VELLEAYFRTNKFRYSMHGLPTGPNALEQFLFEKRQGNCEFFASSFALVLRAAGVPARLVAGYLGGDYNEMPPPYLVSEDMAHVWVEAFIPGRGWVRIDPSGLALNAGVFWNKPKRHDWLTTLRQTLDSLDYSWNRAVITYDLERQVEAARSIGKRL
jgi:transglutaminase-like putative cysteine protease